jgi:formate dehydrogenase subunit delta
VTVDIAKLVRMAEQITANMRFTEDEAVVAERVADHINRFWDPRMKEAIREHARLRDSDFSPPLRAAIKQLS